jgi:predicted secreted protein
MGFISGIVVFLMIWWVMLFTVLPWGNRPSDNPVIGEVASAPEKPRLWRKFLVTTLISCVLWGIVYGLIAANALNFYDMAAKMAAEDDATHQPQSFKAEKAK